LRFTFVAETEALAHERTRTTFGRYARYDAGVDWDGKTEGEAYDAIRETVKFIAGTPDQVSRQLDAWLIDLKPDEVLAQMFAAGTRHEDSLRSMELFAEQVMPRYV
jgi:alkanesulfonate monooxygenase SsuD/methylene tetrahydromethanopterin reductase-like flavin-dependent oxidoreductase (luciferase family)